MGSDLWLRLGILKTSKPKPARHAPAWLRVAVYAVVGWVGYDEFRYVASVAATFIVSELLRDMFPRWWR